MNLSKTEIYFAIILGAIGTLFGFYLIYLTQAYAAVPLALLPLTGVISALLGNKKRRELGIKIQRTLKGLILEVTIGETVLLIAFLIGLHYLGEIDIPANAVPLFQIVAFVLYGALAWFLFHSFRKGLHHISSEDKDSISPEKNHSEHS